MLHVPTKLCAPAHPQVLVVFGGQDGAVRLLTLCCSSACLVD
jgi:hypothetical protein